MTRPNTARRAFLGGALALPASAVAAPALDPVKDAAERLASAMAARHGGRWVAHVDHESGFALVQQRRTRSTKGGAA